MVNILHASDFHSRVNTGITVAINSLIEQTRPLLSADSKIVLISVNDGDVEPPHGTISVRLPMSRFMFASAWRYTPRYEETSERLIRENGISIMHVHGVWLHPHYAAVQAASRLDIPIVLTNHGHLESWALDKQKAFKKRLYLATMKERIFKKVAVFHAITQQNKLMIHELFPGSRIELIPNSIDLADVDKVNGRSVRPTGTAPYILFIGRLAPQKGIDLLIHAFERAQVPSEWRLLIAGPEEIPAYAKYLRGLIAKSPRGSRIELLGPIWNAATKYRLMRDAWLMAVPSRSEVIALVNLEASACSTPTITTFATGLIDWELGGGVLTDAKVASLAAALQQAGQWSDLERADRGRASRRLIEQRYSTRVTGPLWTECYQSLLR